MGVEVHEREAGVARRLRAHDRVADRVIAAEREDARAGRRRARAMPRSIAESARGARRDLEVARVPEARVRAEVEAGLGGEVRRRGAHRGPDQGRRACGAPQE